MSFFHLPGMCGLFCGQNVAALEVLHSYHTQVSDHSQTQGDCEAEESVESVECISRGKKKHLCLWKTYMPPGIKLNLLLNVCTTYNLLHSTNLYIRWSVSTVFQVTCCVLWIAILIYQSMIPLH